MILATGKAGERRQEMEKAIDVAWANPEGAALRAQLFPNGKPTPEEFIRTISAHVKGESR